MHKEPVEPPEIPEPPAMGERRARWGYGYQDKVATERTLNSLRRDLRESTDGFEGIRLADLHAGRVDDFVLVWGDRVEGNSIKWSAAATPLNWSSLIGAAGLLKELAEGYVRLRARWVGRKIGVRLQSNRVVSRETHHAQLVTSMSVEEFLARHWTKGPGSGEVEGTSEIWRTIAEHVALPGPEFASFIASCELSFGQPEPPNVGPDSVDARHYTRQFDSLHKAIATWLTNQPTADLIERDYLFAAIGFRTSRSSLIQRFPEPEIPYERNQAAAERLREIAEATLGGYINVLGPAGVGKSTLVQDVLTSGLSFFVPYYAFLPNTEGNRDRAEALTFFQDVVERLDRLGPPRLGIGIADVAQGRSELRRYMSSANKRYVLHGQKTVLLIDGLDHVMREVGLQASVLQELPHPSEVPEGFIIILSGQPQAFLPDAIPAAVAAVAAEASRTVAVSGLSRPEVHAVIARVKRPTTGSERDALHKACLGNPLILTYLLNSLERSPAATVEALIELGGNYEGHIDQYYRERLSRLLQHVQTRQALGLLCRAAPALDASWLAEWPEKNVIEDVYQRELAPFTRADEGRVLFIHDSLISFLRSETRSRLPVDDPATEERRFYSVLADRAKGRTCTDPVGRARITYLVKAGRLSDVLEQLSSQWLREGVKRFLPFDHLRPLLLSGFYAASLTKEWGKLLRLVLLGHELSQRTARIEAGKLAELLLSLDEPTLAVAQIRSAGRLLVDDDVALQFATELRWYARARDRADLEDLARRAYLEAKPIWLIHSGEPVDAELNHEQQKTLVAWLQAAPLFEQLESVTNEVLKLSFRPARYQAVPGWEEPRSQLLFSALGSALSAGRDLEACQSLTTAIQKHSSATWIFLALLRLAASHSAAVETDVIRQAYATAETDLAVQLAYAWIMMRRGEESDAQEVVRSLKHIRFDELEGPRSWGFDDVSYTVRLRWLQELLGISEGPVPAIKQDKEAHARAERTARRLGELRATVMKGHVIKDLHSVFRSLLLFHNLAVEFDTLDPHTNYVLVKSKMAIYRQIVELAMEVGAGGLAALRDVFLDLTNGSAAQQFSAQHRRFFARFFFDHGSFTRERAVQLGLSSALDVLDDDPGQRQDACLEIAIFLHHVGEAAASKDWVRRASEVSAGAGSHKDYHMAHVAEWLTRSITRANSAELPVLNHFAQAVEIAGGRGGGDGAASILQFLTVISPARARQLAVEWVDRGVLNVSDSLESLIAGGAEAKADPELLCAAYCEMHSLISPGDTTSAAVAVLEAFPPGRRKECAIGLMSHVRSNALPSHRVEVARGLQDSLRREGLEPVDLTDGLPPGRDDSSLKSQLYKSSSGNLQTLEQVAARLSDPLRPDEWNPNEAENKEFDWWTAIKKARIESREHLDGLIARFAVPDYREVELLARKAELALQADDRDLAAELAEHAIVRARDGSWHRWFDGAMKVVALRALTATNREEGVRRAHEQFSQDVGAGKLSLDHALSDMPRILELLAADWPAEAVRDAVDDYLKEVLQGNQRVPSYAALSMPVPTWSSSQALCMFVGDLLAFPAVDIGVTARRVLGRYVANGGADVVATLAADSESSLIHLESLLIALHVGSSGTGLQRLRPWIESLNASESLSVRSVAKRICEERGWPWAEIRTEVAQPVLLLDRGLDRDEDRSRIIEDDVTIAWDLHRSLMRHLERAGCDPHELRSEFEHIYHAAEKEYPWADGDRLQRWMRRLLVKHWLNTRAIIGRDAAMRIFGRRSLSGQIPVGAEDVYDQLAPIYDRSLELHPPENRPIEFTALNWSLASSDEDTWSRGLNTEWIDYPTSARGMSIIGERSRFIRPEWNWPREERYRGLLLGEAAELCDRSVLETEYELTYEMYADGHGQDDHQLVVTNSERQLAGPAFRWAAINANFAHSLDWRLSDVPFQWLDADGNVMIESIYWKDGWIWIEPPRFEPLGEGWMVLATSRAIAVILDKFPRAAAHLWVERHSHGKRKYNGQWHLTRTLSIEL